MNKSVEKQIQEIYNNVFSKIYNTSSLGKLSRGDRSEILQLVTILESSQSYNKFAKKFAKELSKKGLRRQRGVWRKYYEAARKLHHTSLPSTWKEFELQQMSKAVKHNFLMIKSIPRETLKVMEHRYTSKLIEEVAKGKLPRGSFQREMEKHGMKNAKMIARTETAKLQTAIMESRATDLGSVVYQWQSSNDKRTRQSHRDMNGVIVFWRSVQTEKPLLDGMYGNAGEFPNCRCSPEPIFDEDDLEQTRYRVYDFHNHQVVTMGKKELLKQIQIYTSNIKGVSYERVSREEQPIQIR